MLYDPSSPSFYFWPPQPNISEHHSNKTVRVNQQAEQQLMVPFNVWKGHTGLGNVEVLIVLWGRER